LMINERPEIIPIKDAISILNFLSSQKIPKYFKDEYYDVLCPCYMILFSRSRFSCGHVLVHRLFDLFIPLFKPGDRQKRKVDYQLFNLVWFFRILSQYKVRTDQLEALE
ncbi:MAG: hypothetical protein K8S18_11150, partial [Desulfobacula sp.]|nr:hypothetical protein [Desulfobacula sp.]